jgi:hypothetical protein
VAEEVFDNPTDWVAKHIRRYVSLPERLPRVVSRSESCPYARWHQERNTRELPVVEPLSPP